MYKKIKVEELAELLRNNAELSILNSGGVNDWEWYDECFTSNEELVDYINQSNEQITKEYKTI